MLREYRVRQPSHDALRVGGVHPQRKISGEFEVCCSHRTVTQEGRISPEEEGSLCRSTVSSLRSTATKRC